MALGLRAVWLAAFAALTAGLPAAFAASAAGDGTVPLRVGVAFVPPPYTTTDVRLYTEEGFDLDLARALGQRLGRPVALIEVPVGQGWAAALRSGAVDLVVARVAPDDPLYDAAVVRTATVRKTGFASGAAVAMRTDTTIRHWDDLRGRTVCLSEADRRARAIATGLGARLRVERAPARSLMLVRTGGCDVALHDAALLAELFERPAWRKFSTTLPARTPTDLVVALPEPAPDPDLAARVAAALDGIGTDAAWAERRRRWAANVALEVQLDQEAPDCH